MKFNESTYTLHSSKQYITTMLNCDTSMSIRPRSKPGIHCHGHASKQDSRLQAHCHASTKTLPLPSRTLLQTLLQVNRITEQVLHLIHSRIPPPTHPSHDPAPTLGFLQPAGSTPPPPGTCSASSQTPAEASGTPCAVA